MWRSIHSRLAFIVGRCTSHRAHTKLSWKRRRVNAERDVWNGSGCIVGTCGVPLPRSSVIAFVQPHNDSPAAVWRSVRIELGNVRTLIPWGAANCL